MLLPELEITDVQVNLRDEDRLRAFASITLNHSFVVRDLKVIMGPDGIFVAMPSRRRADGRYHDVAHPLNAAMRTKVEESVLSEYNDARSRRQA
jgi:stage V sporulation protein G